MRHLKGVPLLLALLVMVSPAVQAKGKQPHPYTVAPDTTRVAIYNDSLNGHGSYFNGGDSNSYALVQSILDSDPQERFTTTVVTDLSAATLANFDVLSLPDNAVPDQYLAAVAAWFVPGKVIVCFDSAVSYAAYSGFFWPGYGGDVYNGTLWDYGSCYDDGQIAQVDYITSDYTVGQAVSTIGGDAEFYPNMLPADANVFLASAGCAGGESFVAARQGNGVPNLRSERSREETGSALVYGAYRDVSCRNGRMVLLGPYDRPGDSASDAWPMIRNAHLMQTAPPISYDLSFLDDYGRSQLCVSSASGAWQYSVLKGNGTGKIYTGCGPVVTGSGYMRLTATPGSGYGLNLIYYTTAHRATATFTYRPDAVSSALYDQNTTNNQTTCGGGTQPGY